MGADGQSSHYSGPRTAASSSRMSVVDTVLFVKPPGRRSSGHLPRSSAPSGCEVGQGFVLLLLMLRVEALLLGAERPGLVQQLARGGAARHLERLASGP